MTLPKYAMDVAGMKKDQEEAAARRAAGNTAASEREASDEAKAAIVAGTEAREMLSAAMQAVIAVFDEFETKVIAELQEALAQATTEEEMTAAQRVADAKLDVAEMKAIADVEAVFKEVPDDVRTVIVAEMKKEAAKAKRARAKAQQQADVAKAEAEIKAEAEAEAQRQAAAATAEAEARQQADADRKRESSESLTPIDETHGLGEHASDEELRQLIATAYRPTPSPLMLPSRKPTMESQVPPAPDASDFAEVPPRVSAPPIRAGAAPSEANHETLMDMRPPIARDSRPSPTPSPATSPATRAGSEETTVIIPSPPSETPEPPTKPSNRLSREDKIALAAGGIMLLASTILFIID